MAIFGYLQGKKFMEKTCFAGHISSLSRPLGCLVVLGEILMRRLVLLLAMFVILPSIASAGYREDFEKEFMSEPWAGEQIEEDVCIQCHSSDTMKPAFRNIVDEWKTSWHFQNKVSCHDCHGGDPKDAATAMSPKKGFLATPTYVQVPEFCG